MIVKFVGKIVYEVDIIYKVIFIVIKNLLDYFDDYVRSVVKS